MHHMILAAGVWHDTWRIATSVVVLFLILAWWNWLMKNLGTF
ncbi:MAG: hypothetical protein QOF76_4380 [Solirubrobacteraceae bacterium]|jgi:hypothetical protein|nr:hypothetical protein [Solirubrobacteraceae bacterium]